MRILRWVGPLVRVSHGDIATAGRASLTVTARFSGRGAIAIGGGASLTGTRQQLTGHGDIAVTGRAAVQLSLPLRAHGDIALGSDADLSASLVVQGRGNIAITGRAGEATQLDLRGQGNIAVGTRGAIQLALPFTGHGDIATTGQTSARIAVALSGSGAVCTVGTASLTVVEDPNRAVVEQPTTAFRPPVRQHRVFRSRIRYRLTILVHYTAVPIVWSGSLNVVVGGVTVIQPRHQPVHHRLERRARIQHGCRRTKIYSGPIEARTAARRSYRRELLTVGPELLL